MRYFLLLISLLPFFLDAQDSIQRPFASKVIGYSGLGIDFTKIEGDAIVEAHKVRIADSGDYYRCDAYINQDSYIVFGTVLGDDTINKRRYDLHFLPTPDPKFTWDLESDRKEIVLHKDSLDSLENLRVTWPKYLPRKPKITIVNSTVSWPGLKGAPGRFLGSRIPDSIAQRMTEGKDTLFLSMTSTIYSEDQIRRQIGAVVTVILLEGEAYERAIDPFYDYNHFSDTTELTWKKFKGNDTLTLDIRKGHLFIWFPREKEDYWVDFEDVVEWGNLQHCFNTPPIKVPAGKGKFLLDASMKSELYEVKIMNKLYAPIRKKSIFFNIIDD